MVSCGKLEIAQNAKVAKNGKSCSKYEKLPKSCRGTCGKRYIISISKTMTKESKKTKNETFVIVLARKRAVLNGSTKSRFKICLEFFLRRRINCFSQ